MEYTSYEYLWPPRPEKAIPKQMLAHYAKLGWVGQCKKNGTCSIIAVSPEKKLVTMNRHKETHKLWTPTEKSSEAFRALPGKGWYVIVAELMHSKVSGGPRDTNYINDILVADGEYLVGKTFVQRQTILRNLFLKGDEESTTSHYIINNNTWLAKNRLANFTEFFDSLDKPEDEGIVLKNPNAPLALCLREKSNVSWSVKCRRPHKNYGF